MSDPTNTMRRPSPSDGTHSLSTGHRRSIVGLILIILLALSALVALDTGGGDPVTSPTARSRTLGDRSKNHSGSPPEGGRYPLRFSRPLA